MFCVLPSVYVPVAVNCWVDPKGSDGIAGVTTIDTRVAGVTEIPVEPVMLPDAAVTLVLPTATADAKPCALTVATVVSAIPQLTEFVRSRVLPSV